MDLPNIPVFPKVSYYLLSENNNDVYCLVINRLTKIEGSNKLILNSYNNDEKLKTHAFDGSNIEIGPSFITVNKEYIYKFSELAVGLHDNDCYLIAKDTLTRLMKLPNTVSQFLEMSIYREGPISLTIYDDKPFILRTKYSNTVPIQENISWMKELNTDRSYNTRFVLVKDDNGEETNKSHFIKDNTKYFIEDCYILPRGKGYIIAADMKDSNGVTCHNISINLYYI